jgi:hypothetical protein
MGGRDACLCRMFGVFGPFGVGEGEGGATAGCFPFALADIVPAGEIESWIVDSASCMRSSAM